MSVDRRSRMRIFPHVADLSVESILATAARVVETSRQIFATNANSTYNDRTATTRVRDRRGNPQGMVARVQ
jgi:hypothetical protein